MPILFTSNAITAPPPPTAPTIQLASSPIVEVGEESTLLFVGVTEDDDYTWGLLAGPASATTGGESTAQFTVTWTPAEAGTTTITIGLKDGAGLQTVESFGIEIIDPVETALSVAEITNPTGTLDLTATSADWMAFSHTTGGQITRKDGASLITDFALFGHDDTPRNSGEGSVPTLDWADGDDPETATGVVAATARWMGGKFSGVAFKLASSASQVRAARVFLRARAKAAGVETKVRVSAAVGTRPPVSTEIKTTSTDRSQHCVEIGYRVSSEDPVDVTIGHVGAEGAFFLRAIQVVGGSGAALEASPSTWTAQRGVPFVATVTLTGLSDLTGVEIVSPNLPTGASFVVVGAVGTLRWTPAAAAPDSYLFDIVARRGTEVLARLLKTADVDDPPVAGPVLTAPATWTLTRAVAGTLSGVSATGTGTISIRASGLRGSAVFVSKPAASSTTGTGYWTPVVADVGNSTLTLTATDGEGRTDVKTVAVTVN